MNYRKLMWVLFVLLFIFLAVFLSIKLNPAFGGKATGDRLELMIQSPNFSDGKFQNPVETVMQTDDMPFFKLMKEFFFTKGDRVPADTIPVIPLNPENYSERTGPARMTWLGHSSVLIEISGKTILTDPVFGKRISPFSFIGTKAFAYSHSYKLTDLPPVDLVLISHDHYDHLDYSVIKQLVNTDVPFVTALGVGAHLEYWGISPERITELDWWESYILDDVLLFTATPARHFSGRGLTNRFSTLWASWVIESRDERLFFGADSGYYPGFKEIGDKFGHFDLVMLECGQYSRYWPFIHMSPEETVRAALDLNAKALLPIHWGKYKLSIHPWTEPVERLLKAAEGSPIQVTTPKIGEVFTLDKRLPDSRWWREDGKN